MPRKGVWYSALAAPPLNLLKYLHAWDLRCLGWHSILLSAHITVLLCSFCTVKLNVLSRHLNFIDVCHLSQYQNKQVHRIPGEPFLNNNLPTFKRPLVIDGVHDAAQVPDVSGPIPGRLHRQRKPPSIWTSASQMQVRGEQ